MKYTGTLIAVKDMEKSKQFYHDVLGMEVDFMWFWWFMLISDLLIPIVMVVGGRMIMKPFVKSYLKKQQSQFVIDLEKALER